MLTKLRKSQTEGFTIIEVMIVLAIAALILLIVLLAVPALQRNARNTTLKNDASSVAGGISTSETDNNGTPPTNVAGAAGSGIATVTNTNNETTKINGGTTVTFTAAAGVAPTGAGSGAGQLPISTVNVWAGHTCPVAQGGSGQTSAHAFAIFFDEETSGNPVLQCSDT